MKKRVKKEVKVITKKRMNKKGMKIMDMNLSKKSIVILGVISAIVVIVLLIVLLNRNSVPTTCGQLSRNFDRLVAMGCTTIANDGEIETTAGARLLNITSTPTFIALVYYNIPGEYRYKIILKGQTREQTFTLATQDLVLPQNLYKTGEYYKFDFRTLCGPVLSSGPHSGGYIFSDNNMTVLQSKKC